MLRFKRWLPLVAAMVTVGGLATSEVQAAESRPQAVIVIPCVTYTYQPVLQQVSGGYRLSGEGRHRCTSVGGTVTAHTINVEIQRWNGTRWTTVAWNQATNRAWNLDATASGPCRMESAYSRYRTFVTSSISANVYGRAAYSSAFFASAEVSSRCRPIGS